VIDIAAGKGALSTSLAARCGPLRCTLIEPAPRHCTSQLGPFCQLLALPFDHAFAECHSELLARSSIFVGLHPDQATEAVVVEALAHGKPFAVVPCCVYPTLFPSRYLQSGQRVRSYRAFIRYLREKHPQILTARLPFEGRNKVLFWDGPASDVTLNDAALQPLGQEIKATVSRQEATTRDHTAQSGGVEGNLATISPLPQCQPPCEAKQPVSSVERG